MFKYNRLNSITILSDSTGDNKNFHKMTFLRQNNIYLSTTKSNMLAESNRWVKGR